jgi:uncharacterized tellurite resistance protein B-like protein
MSILAWLGLEPPAPPDEEGALVRRIVGQLESMEPAAARRLALFAFLLARVANVDLDIAQGETAEMERLVADHGGLTAAQAALVVQIAKAEHRLLGPTHDFLAARELRDLASAEQRLDLLRALFAVAAADGSISTAEEEEIRIISRTLLLEERDFLAIRATYSERRAVLQGWPRRDRAT